MNATIDNVHAVILAAGASSRMGEPKQLLEWQNRSLLAHAIQNARSVMDDRIVVVLGAHAEAIRATADLDDTVAIVNPDWREGMASSIRAGILALPASASAALIMLCDQPLINSTHLQTILSLWQTEPVHIVASRYNDAIGVPALFPAGFFRPLLQLKGDRGAKRLLMESSENLITVPLPEAELDIDDEDDFDHLTGHYAAEE